jgi:RNase P subunit RPR2
VLGWQEALLELNAVCDRCNAILARGTRAAIAVTEGAGPRPIRCLACLKEVTDGSR